ncbi:PAB-dependent poly(A)-specific ribonuclease subunit 3 [Zygosaccharomyces mellis]|uniref:PAN2-PAN3 deadenylation complex subunit PAN3 n=1 Tax=Zygosaccharomyces mellis TaxID=42258 RepID=A0A4C2E7K9_9SACH|nr:PAB-dependent poly(A)-specific ribonuclease subunit 3 [Zygosaccharomyces mellis]
MSGIGWDKMDWPKDIPCRNITIYGFCKKEKEGCPFKHDSNDYTNVKAPTSAYGENSNSSFNPLVSSNTGSSTPKFNAKTSASFTPMSAKTSSFVPLNSGSTNGIGSVAEPSWLSAVPQPSYVSPTYNPYATGSFTPSSSAGNPLNPMGITPPDPATDFNLPIANTATAMSIGQLPQADTDAKVNLPIMYPPMHSLLQYHLYAPDPPPHLRASLRPNERMVQDLFIPNELREQLVKRNLASLQIFPLGGAIPSVVQDYFGLVPLDFNKNSGKKDSFMGHKNSLYKVFSNVDGKVYLLRRIHLVANLEPSYISKTFHAWNNVDCNNVVKLVDLFLTTQFGDSSLCAVYDFYPMANSLYEDHFVNFPLKPITQEYLWSYLVQLCNALNAVHSQGLVVDILDLHKVIVTGSPGRIKIADCGPLDVLKAGKMRDITAEQQESFVKLGKLLIELATKLGPEGGAQTESVDNLVVDERFKDVLKYLVSDKPKSVTELTFMFHSKIFSVIDSSLAYAEYTEGVLSKELENGRLFRLICKLNFIYGRMEQRIDVNWSESGEKFPILLFYDYVFHQVDASGKNIMDLTHVLRCLNKLDAGVGEKVALVTPDEMNCIIVSYKELRDLIDITFRMLCQ